MKPKPLYRILPYVACLLACTAVNLIYFPAATVFPDEQRILASAVTLAKTGEFWVGGDRAWEMPGAALLFAPWVWLLGLPKAIIAIRFTQTAMLLLQCGLIGGITHRVARQDSAAFIATCITAIYPFFLFYQGLLLSETLFNTLLLGGVAALYAWQAQGTRFDRMFVLACLCFAAATMTKATLTILPPLLLALAAWVATSNLRRSALVLVAAAGVYAALLSPWWIRNVVVLGHFVPFSTSSAQNLYLGNNPNNIDAGIDWSYDVEPNVAERLLAMPDELERQRAFADRAITYIKAHPVAFIQAAAKKFLRLWNVVPNATEFRGVYALVSALSFGPVLLLAVAGVGWQWRQWRRFSPLLLIIGYFTFVHIVTIASLRYRLPLEPVLIVLAATTLGAVFAKTRQFGHRPA